MNSSSAAFQSFGTPFLFEVSTPKTHNNKILEILKNWIQFSKTVFFLLPKTSYLTFWGWFSVFPVAWWNGKIKNRQVLVPMHLWFSAMWQPLSSRLNLHLFGWWQELVLPSITTAVCFECVLSLMVPSRHFSQRCQLMRIKMLQRIDYSTFLH